MAVSNYGNRIILTALNDAVTGPLRIQAIAHDHTAAANCTIQDTATHEIARLHVTATMLTTWIQFKPPLSVDGIKATTLSGGQVTVYLA